ncbi:MAG: aminotransferase class I/II-fold pyridoxal phosphate-dependent enzyme [Ruminococcaceae bacterium]|nr:aminotransferase class I/II-fold pyridoxal phosphate-dependent enzyme [Oscillospiraceae bacterium]
MLSFECDYNTGAHPKILEALVRTNMEPCPGYGNDIYTAQAREKIRSACGREDADVRFLVGGTQTNRIVIDSMLKNYEGVIAATTGHISAHEAGAIEASGHKVLTVPGYDGKLHAADVEKLISSFYADGSHDHMVFPGMVYISHPTEYGTLYTLDELKQLSALCHRHSLPLFLDGARLGYGLMSLDTDVTLQDIAQLCDVFYIGGTKVGALCGEAVVFTHSNAPAHFFTTVKQNGALLAKGRLLGIQFATLFEDGLYFEISKNAIDRTEDLKKLFREKGYPFFKNSPTNQQFIVLSDEKIAELSPLVRFEIWERVDDTHCAVRFATSWATTKEDIENLRAII